MSGCLAVRLLGRRGVPTTRQNENLTPGRFPRRVTQDSLAVLEQSLGAWGEVFGDPVIATAVLDRLLHHSITVNIRGDSYRLREKLKAGLLRPKLVSDPGNENDNT